MAGTASRRPRAGDRVRSAARAGARLLRERRKALRLAVVAVVLAALTASLAAACAPATGPGSTLFTPRPAQAGQLDDEAVHAAGAFGVALYRQLLAEEGELNRFISPYSIALALSMTYNGAVGPTAEELAAALRLGDLDRQTLNEAHAALLHLLAREESGVALAIANSLWGRQGQLFQEAFLTANADYYAAALEELDFGRPEAVDIINGWVAEHTGGHIEEMYAELPANLVLLLLNAIYFEGDWTAPFDPQRTQEAPFYNLDGSTGRAPLMSQTGDFAHLEADGVQAVRLPYGEPEELAMYVFLPSEELGIAGFHQALAYDRLRAWLAAFTDGEIFISLPRFELEYEAELNDALQAMGMELAFTPAADFSAMRAGGGLWIDHVKHKSFVSVDEEGTTAAAATSVAMIERAPAFSMVVDRPFFFIIHDAASDAILFMGSVVELGG